MSQPHWRVSSSSFFKLSFFSEQTFTHKLLATPFYCLPLTLSLLITSLACGQVVFWISLVYSDLKSWEQNSYHGALALHYKSWIRNVLTLTVQLESTASQMDQLSVLSDSKKGSVRSENHWKKNLEAAVRGEGSDRQLCLQVNEMEFYLSSVRMSNHWHGDQKCIAEDQRRGRRAILGCICTIQPTWLRLSCLWYLTESPLQKPTP